MNRTDFLKIKRSLHTNFTVICKTIGRFSLIFSFILLTFFYPRNILIAQGQWVWLNGDSTSFGPSVYGTKGVPSTSVYPRASHNAVDWGDSQGNFWYHSADLLQDLWKYNPLDNTWTWVHGPGTASVAQYGTKGIADPNNLPELSTGNIGKSWTDRFDNLWYYYTNTWKYDPTTNMWTWVHGPGTPNTPSFGTKNVSAPSNNPGGRGESTCTWVDKNDDFWMFGGSNNVGYMNDLWKYDHTLNEWVWVNGLSTLNAPASYGTKGVPSPTNNPGARRVYCSWYDEPSHSLYLFGGRLIFGNGRADMWKYDIDNDVWTWVSGSSGANDLGNYGTQCVPDVNNYPPLRFHNKVNWKDDCGNFWMYAGTYIGGPFEALNDIWKYKPSTNEWTWVQGPQGKSTAYNWGTKGVLSPTNQPPPALGASSTASKNGFFIYGSQYNLSPAVWQYVPDPPIAKFGFNNNCGNVQFTDSTETGCNEIKSYRWDFGDGDTSDLKDPIHQYSSNGPFNVELIVSNCTYQKDTFSLVVNVTLSSSSSNTTNICDGDSILLGGEFRKISGVYADTLFNGNHLGCDSIITTILNVDPLDNGGFSFSQGSYCPSDPNPTPTITGTPGGTFSIDNSGIITASTGEVNISGSGIGAYTITYTTNGICPVSNSRSIVISNGADATIAAIGPFCLNNPEIPFSASDPGGSWNGNGITDSVAGTFNPAIAGVGTHEISYTITGSCGDSDTIDMVVLDFDDATFGFTSSLYCTTDTNPIPTITGLTGGTFSIDNSGNINVNTGTINLLSSGVGNFAITYTTAGTCPDSSSVNVEIITCVEAAFIIDDNTLCKGTCTNFANQSEGATSWQWTFNGGSPSSSTTENPNNICYNDTGSYTVQLIAVNSFETDTTEQTVYVSRATIDAGQDRTIDFGNNTTLTAIGEDGMYTWFPEDWLSCSNCQSPIATPEETITYTVNFVDTNNCSANDEVTITVTKNFATFIPTAFTPDGDNINELFYPEGLNITKKDYSFKVFNRWGEVLFESDEPEQGWNGKYKGTLVPLGTYVWKLDFTDLDNIKQQKVGRVKIVR